MSPGEVISSRAAPCRHGLRLLVPALLLAAAWPAGAAPHTVAADDRTLAREALRVAPGQPLVVEGLWLERDAAPVALELERVEVWAPGAVVEIDGKRGPAPASAVFRGRVRGWLDSIAVLTVAESGESDGLLLREGEGWALGRARDGGLASRRADMAALDKPFACGNEDAGFRRLNAAPLPFEEPADPATDGTASLTAASHAGVPYTATLALETDAEYFARFAAKADPRAAALDYLALLIAYGDVVYSREVDTALRIGFARLWTGGAASDPWTITAGTVDALFQFQDHWNANMAHVQRTAAHFLSGKNLGGGVAYVGTLCQGHDRPGSSNDYGLSANISGGFSWNGSPASDPAAVVWDVIVVLHELGHNFNSPHAHDYCGLGGSNQPIDHCYPSQSCGAATGVPSCSSPTPHFSGGAGTIMSYCHAQPGGYANISMTFGEGHTCGDLPWRQADRMSAHVADRASAIPACFAGGGASACPADAYEASGGGGSDDTCDGARIGVGAAQARTLCDEDWARFEPRAGATYRIETSALGGGADTTLGLHVGCGTQIAFNDDYTGAASRIEWTAASGAAVDLRVRSAGAYGDDDAYTLSVTCIGNCGTGCPTDLSLAAQTVNDTQSLKAENTIDAGGGFAVGSKGDVTLHAGASVAFGDGFSVARGGSLTVTAGTTPSCP